MGEHSDRQHRWDLLPVASIGLPESVWGPMFLDGLWTAGRLATALDSDVAPPSLKDVGRRKEAEKAIRVLKRRFSPAT